MLLALDEAHGPRADRIYRTLFFELAVAMKQRQLRAELNHDNLPEIVRDLPGPIVMTDNDLLMQLWHYEPLNLAHRLVFLADPQAAVEYQGFNTIELLLWSQRLQVERYAPFGREHRDFLLIDTLRGYVAKKLLKEGARITALTSYRDKWVFRIETHPANYCPGSEGPLP